VARASADGYTLVLANSSPMSISPFAIEKSPYDPIKGFTHVAYIGATPLIIVANPKAGLNSVADLVKAIKAKPDYAFGSGGPASIGHIVGEMMKTELKANMTHIPYKGGALMVPDLIAGTIPIGFDVSTAYVQLVKGGQLKALALTGTKRSDLLPDVPTIVEAGFPNLVSENYFGISAPPGLPADVADKLYKAVTEALAQPATRKKLEETGLVLQPMTQVQYTAYVSKQAKDWEPAVRASGAKL
jgi:tripartite-type tricarboxylate transporter receptor subunit TctC